MDSSNNVIESGSGPLASDVTARVAASAAASSGAARTDGLDPASILIHESNSCAQVQTTSYERTANRLNRYAPAHARAEAMAWYLHATGEHDLGEKLLDCGTYLVFRDYYTENKNRLHAGTFCQKHLLCPLCAIRRGAKMLRRYVPKVATVLSGGGRLYLATWTVKDGPDLAERFGHLRDAIQLMHERRRQRLTRGNNPRSVRRWTESAKARGIVFSYEVKRGANSGLWHPHVHAIWLCDEPPSVTAMSNEWRELTGDSHVVDVRPLNSTPELARASTAEELLDWLAGDFAEVFKYALKLGEMPLADNRDAAKFLHGRRLISSVGDLRGVEVPDDLLDDELDETDFAYIEYFATYQGDSYDLSRVAPSRRPRELDTELTDAERQEFTRAINEED